MKYSLFQRWAVCMEDWIPEESEWTELLKRVQPEERIRIGKFKRSAICVGRNNPDARTALIGRLLLRKMCSDVTGIPVKDICLDRVHRSRKPYCKIPEEVLERRPELRSFNVNISHSGNWVVGSSAINCLVGVDVQEIPSRFLEDPKRSLSAFEDHFTNDEWERIRSQLPCLVRTSRFGDPHSNALNEFSIHWTLKEALIKANGLGFGFDLQRASMIQITPENSQYVSKSIPASNNITNNQPSKARTDSTTSENEYDEPELRRPVSPTKRMAMMSLRDSMQFIVKLDGEKKTDMFFETSQLDDFHYVSIGLTSLNFACDGSRGLVIPKSLCDDSDLNKNVRSNFYSEPFKVVFMDDLM